MASAGERGSERELVWMAGVGRWCAGDGVAEGLEIADVVACAAISHSRPGRPAGAR